MSMEKYKGNKIRMMIDDKKLVCRLREINNFEIIVESDEKIIHIPHHKIGIYEVLDEPKLNNVVNIYMCKNDEISCKGCKFLSVKDDCELNVINCPYDRKSDCDFGMVGNLFDLPDNIKVAFLNGMKNLDNMPKQNKDEVKK